MPRARSPLSFGWAPPLPHLLHCPVILSKFFFIGIQRDNTRSKSLIFKLISKLIDGEPSHAEGA